MRSRRSRRWTAAGPCCLCDLARRRAAVTTTRRHLAVCRPRHRNRPGHRQVLWTPSRRRVPQVSRSDRSRCSRRSGVHLVMDNYATHKTPLIRNWLAKRPRWHVHLTPTSSSWLNQVERFFALITERKIRRGIYRRLHYAPKSLPSSNITTPTQSRSDGQNQPTTNASVLTIRQPRLKMPRTFGSGHQLPEGSVTNVSPSRMRAHHPPPRQFPSGTLSARHRS